MRQSFQVIFLLYALVVPLVTGLFFLIITLQKAGVVDPAARDRAPARRFLARALLIEVVVVLGLGLGVGIALYAPLSQSQVGGLSLRFDPGVGADLVSAAHRPRGGERTGVAAPGAAHRPAGSHHGRRGAMRIALRELVRRKVNFAVATVILTLIALLLMFLGGLLDGLSASSTGAYRAQKADVVVYSSSARSRWCAVASRLGAAGVAGTSGVEEVGGLGSAQLGARPGDAPQTRDLLSTVLFGYELAPRGCRRRPRRPGTVVADTALRPKGCREGDTLLLGPGRVAGEGRRVRRRHPLPRPGQPVGVPRPRGGR